ncbi:MAG: type II toxin-antitoxin system VapC family toxin [Thermoanaerobaculia bacterium]
MTAAKEIAWIEPLYLDASALVKLFVHEAESESLNEALLGASGVILSDLALTEMASALGRRTREGILTPLQARTLHREAIKLTASCRHVELTPPVHRRAEQFLLSSQLPIRALDALHVATALEAGAATIVTFDHALRDVASVHGLFVTPT